MPYSVRYSHTYSFGFSCILDEVKKCTDFAYFLAGGWGGGGSDPRIPYSGVRREYMVFSVFWPYSTESQNTQNTVITKSPIVITNSTPPRGGAVGGGGGRRVP